MTTRSMWGGSIGALQGGFRTARKTVGRACDIFDLPRLWCLLTTKPPVTRVLIGLIPLMTICISMCVYVRAMCARMQNGHKWNKRRKSLRRKHNGHGRTRTDPSHGFHVRRLLLFIFFPGSQEGRDQGDMKCLGLVPLRTDPSPYFYVRRYWEGGYP